jgi:signal transduction histidine kinase
VANAYMTGSAVTAADLSGFADNVTEPYRGIQELGWYPRVDDAGRQEFEEAARREGLRSFEIKELDPDGLMTPAARRNEYFPARQLEPHKASEALLGFDLGSEAVSLEEVNRARDMGKPVISAPVRFSLETGGQTGILIVAPAYKGGATPVTVEQRRRDFMGVAAWLLSVNNIMEDALKGIRQDRIEIRIEDKSEPSEVLLYDSGAGPARSAAVVMQQEIAQQLGARNWMLTFYPSRQYALAQAGWLAWAFLLAGLLLTGVLSAFLIGVTGHSAAVQRLVSERTAALEAANRELESFSYSVAHDLRSPLTVILGYGRLFSVSGRDNFDPNSRQYLDKVLAGSIRMNSLIDDLLNLSRVNRAPLSAEQINLSDLAAGIVADLGTRDPTRRVVTEIADGVTAICDKGLMKVALENLLGNAWKFTAKKPDARIAFIRILTADETVFCVRDNGAGFDMESAGRLFAPFQRLHPPSEFAGTGIGLATVARIISRHGGRIWVKAAINEGASFFFTLGGRRDLPPDHSNAG